MASGKQHQRRRTIFRQARHSEQLAQTAYIDHYSDRRWYFVMRLDPQQSVETDAHSYEVQVLDQQGRAAAVGYFTDPDAPLTVAQQLIPMAVLHAALRQLPGQGDYVNEAGESIAPW
jgi:hypothetical protein